MILVDLTKVVDQYDLGNEALGIFGARAIEVEPEKSLVYKVADYSKGARNSKNLFKSVALKGGVTTLNN